MPDAPESFIRALAFDGPIDVVETPISWVLLAGEFAYKIKKPATLPFLDYGTRERRRARCEEELRLNRCFAPDLYPDIVELDGEPAVRMRRFDERLRLDRVCARGELAWEALATFVGSGNVGGRRPGGRRRFPRHRFRRDRSVRRPRRRFAA